MRAEAVDAARRLPTPAELVYRLLSERTLSDGSSVLRPAGGRGARRKVVEKVRPAAVRERSERELLPADQAAEALARYAVGEAPAAIALLLGVPKSRIYRFLKERGVLRSRSEAAKVRAAAEGKPWPRERTLPDLLSEDQTAEAVARYAAGEAAGGGRRARRATQLGAPPFERARRTATQ